LTRKVLTGLLAEPGDIKTLADHLERLISNVPERERFGRAAKNRYDSGFTGKHFEENLRKILLMHIMDEA